MHTDTRTICPEDKIAALQVEVRNILAMHGSHDQSHVPVQLNEEQECDGVQAGTGQGLLQQRLRSSQCSGGVIAESRIRAGTAIHLGRGAQGGFVVIIHSERLKGQQVGRLGHGLRHAQADGPRRCHSLIVALAPHDFHHS